LKDQIYELESTNELIEKAKRKLEIEVGGMK
jgi:hypothetical protein